MTPYFEKIAQISYAFLCSLDLPTNPLPIDEIDISFRASIQKDKKTCELALKGLPAPKTTQAGTATLSPGLNTVGVLSDRLTILLIRHCKAHRNEAAAFTEQIREIVAALDQVKKGFSSQNTKVTTLHRDVDSDCFESAFLSLLITNTVLWEAQEVLYQGKIEQLPDSELRKYIQLFSKDNVRRNQYIELTDRLYWAG